MDELVFRLSGAFIPLAIATVLFVIFIELRLRWEKRVLVQTEERDNFYPFPLFRVWIIPMLFVLLASANPIYKKTVYIKRCKNTAFAFDVSKSMDAEDVLGAVSRIDAAKAFALDITKKCDAGGFMSIEYADEAISYPPYPFKDKGAFLYILKNWFPQRSVPNGTSVAEALFLILKLKKSHYSDLIGLNKKRSRYGKEYDVHLDVFGSGYRELLKIPPDDIEAVVVLSDGGGKDVRKEILKNFAAENITIHTVLIGREDVASHIPVYQTITNEISGKTTKRFISYLSFEEGGLALTKAKADMLKNISQKTKGIFVKEGDAGAREAIRTALLADTSSTRTEISQYGIYFLLIGFLVTGIILFVSVVLNRRRIKC